MTLILTIATPAFMVQSSDRLLTRNRSPVDPIANKAILYRAEDAVAAVGYSGIAYISGIPTDEWLATILWGEPIPRGHDNRRPATVHFGKRPNAWNLKTAIEELKRAIGSLRQADIKRGGLVISVASWTRTGDEPLYFEIERAPGARSAKVNSTILRRSLKKIFIGHIGAPIPDNEIILALDQFRKANGNVLSIDGAEAILMGCTLQSCPLTVAGKGDLMGVPIIDPVLIGLKATEFAIELRRVSLPTVSRFGTWQKPPAHEVAQLMALPNLPANR